MPAGPQQMKSSLSNMYITDHKAEARDGMKFKSSFWTGATATMAPHVTLGGVKTPSSCSAKWDWV
jgi:hypothetical protein